MSLLSWCRLGSTGALCAIQILTAGAVAADHSPQHFDETGIVSVDPQAGAAPRRAHAADAERQDGLRRAGADASRSRPDGPAALDVAAFTRLVEPIGATLGFAAFALALRLRRSRRLRPRIDSSVGA